MSLVDTVAVTHVPAVPVVHHGVPPSLTLVLRDAVGNYFTDLKSQIRADFTRINREETQYGQYFFDELLEELFRYLYLLAHHPDSDVVPISPSELVDQDLHVLLLDPRRYQRVCDGLLELLGDTREMRTLPHNPEGGLDRVAQNRTVQEYIVVFRNVPREPIWNAQVPTPSMDNDETVKLSQPVPFDYFAAPHAIASQEPMGVSFRLPIPSLGVTPAVPVPVPTMWIDQIMINDLNGPKFVLNVVSSDSIENVKQKIQDKRGYPIHIQRLIYGGRQLEDDRTLRDYGVRQLSSMDLLFRLRGC